MFDPSGIGDNKTITINTYVQNIFRIYVQKDSPTLVVLESGNYFDLEKEVIYIKGLA